MTSLDTPASPLPPESAVDPDGTAVSRPMLRDAFVDCRAQTLALFAGLTDRQFREQIHPGYSPLGWHLGHIAYTEGHWLVHTCGGEPLPFPELERTFHVEGLAKHERTGIPPFDEVADYAAAVRGQMLDCLDRVDLDVHGRLYWFVLQHECQHAETVTLLTAVRDASRTAASADVAPAGPETIGWVDVPAGRYSMGFDGAAALDNERPAHTARVDAFEMAAAPVTQAQYAAFMADGGYGDRRHWTDAGWAWQQTETVEAPLYWTDGDAEAPVKGISGHEADAWCRWAATSLAGVRLPTEQEWEAAVRHDAARGGGPLAPLAGGVWQWTASLFDGYADFAPWPYPGYSQAYFDGKHRVLRGGSHATRRWATRPSFRNWYTPDTRQLFSGLRPARQTAPANGGRTGPETP